LCVEVSSPAKSFDDVATPNNTSYQYATSAPRDQQQGQTPQQQPVVVTLQKNYYQKTKTANSKTESLPVVSTTAPASTVRETAPAPKKKGYYYGKKIN